MSNTIKTYTDLITSEHADKPNYMAMIRAFAEFAVQVQDVLGSMRTTAFDINTAIGAQLDVLGQWIGVSRNIPVPITDVYFTWDSTDPLGWDFGIWENPLEPDGVVTLPDDVYRNLLRARIAANRWDGTTPNAYDIWAIIFPNTQLLIIDYQDMTMSMGLVGGIVDSLTVGLLTSGLIPLKPEGVRVRAYYVPVNDGPLFGWDVDSEFLEGWETGNWAKELAGE